MQPRNHVALQLGKVRQIDLLFQNQIEPNPDLDGLLSSPLQPPPQTLRRSSLPKCRDALPHD